MKYIKLLVMPIVLLGGGAALAHTELKSSVPADAAVIEESPEAIELTFSEAVRLTALSIQKDGEQKQSLGPLPATMTDTFSVALPAAVGDGHYVVAWRAMSEDTHVMTGEFMFAVGAAASHAEHPAPQAAPAGSDHSGHGAAH